MQEEVYRINYEIEDSYWWFVARNKIILELTLLLTDLKSGETVLDVGCGTGGFSAMISKKFNVICLDNSSLALDFCARRGLKNLYLGTLENFNPPEKDVRAVFLLDVIEHIEDDQSVLNKAYNLLCSGGWIVVTVPAYQWLWSRHDEIHMHKRRYTKLQLKKLLEGEKFQIRFISYFNFFLFFPAVVKRLLVKRKNSEIVEPIEPVGEGLNEIFKKIFLFEKKLLPKLKFPFGLSIVGIAKKE
ncbi:MAG: class I SAM-dependent methyltransferase [Ignavibacteria bacterium]|nr:class I SAM-dependent methyltransferase [Ignavibacteria bacterium]